MVLASVSVIPEIEKIWSVNIGCIERDFDPRSSDSVCEPEGIKKDGYTHNRAISQ